jgi:WD domain, G-beta repeat
MTVHRAGAGLSRWGSLWGIFWRGVLWYAVAGTVLGGLYGCSAVAVSVFSFDAGDGVGELPVRAIRVAVGFCGVVGFAAGWVLARSVGKQMRPLLGAVIGALVGIPLGGYYFAFGYLIAFPFGAMVGGAFGLTVGLIAAVVLTAVTRAFFVPLSDPGKYRRAAVATNVLVAMLVAGFSGVYLLLFPGQEGVGGLTVSATVGLLGYLGIPFLILVLVAQWFGGRLAGWYARSAAQGPPPSARWYRGILVHKAALLISLGLMLAAGAGLAASAAHRTDQDRQVTPRIPTGDVVIYPEADLFAVNTGSAYRIWSLSGRREIRSILLPYEGLAELSPDGRLIAAHYCKKVVSDYCTGDEYGVKVMRARDGATVAKLELPAGGTDLLRWSPDSSTLATFLNNSNNIQLLDMPEARPIRTTKVSDDLGPELAAFAPGGKVLATSHYRSTKLWNVEDGRLLHELPESYYMHAFAFGPNGKVLATGGTGGYLTLWSVEKGQAFRELAHTAEDITALAFSPDGDLLAAGLAYGEVQLRRTSDGKLLETYEGHEGSVTDVAFTPDGRRIISAGADRRVIIRPITREK